MNVIRASKDVNETGPNAYSWKKKKQKHFSATLYCILPLSFFLYAIYMLHFF